MVLGLIQYRLGGEVPRQRRASRRGGNGKSAPVGPRAPSASLADRLRDRRRDRGPRDRRCRPTGVAQARSLRGRDRAPGTSCSVSRSSTSRPAPLREAHGGGEEAHRRHLRLLHGGRALLGRLRAGRLVAQPVHRPPDRTATSSASTIPTSWFQSVNSMFLIVLAPVFGALWIKLGQAAAVDGREDGLRPASSSPSGS